MKCMLTKERRLIMKKFLSAVVAMALVLSMSPAVFAADFVDVPDDAWYIHALRCAEDLGMVYGDGAGYFNPDTPVTLAQYVTMLGRVMSDVKGAGYDPYLTWARDIGYIDSSTYGADSTITMEQFAVFLVDFMELTGVVPQKFWSDLVYTDDEDVSDFAKDSVKRLAEYSMLVVGEDSMLHPEKEVTRAECMVALAAYAMSLREDDWQFSYFENY